MPALNVPALLLAVTLAAPALAQPLSNAFTYQGELDNAAAPANGPHDFLFALYDSSTGNVQVGSFLCSDNLAVENGRFSVSLDFGPVFTGQSRYLEVRVRQDTGLDCSNGASFVTLSPRTNLTAAPHAAFALTSANSTSATQLAGQPASFYTNANNLSAGFIPSSRLSGFYSSPVTFNNAGNVFVGSGFGITDLNASNINVGVLSPARGGTGSNTTTATTNQVLKWSGSAWIPGNDIDTNTTYTAGAGLTLAGNIFSIPANGINSGFLANPAVSGGAGGTIADDSITSFDLASQSASLAKVSGGVLSVTAGNLVATGEYNFAAAQPSFYMITPAEFTARDGAVLYNSNGPEGGVYPNTTSFSGIVAPIHLPHGATITAVHYYVIDNAAIDFLCNIYRQNPAGGLINAFAAASTSGASTSVQDLTASGVNLLVDNSLSNYRIIIQTTAAWSGQAAHVRGVRIDYTMPRPAR